MAGHVRIALVFMGTYLLMPAAESARAVEEFAFFHENVLGTSLELRIRADHQEAARSAEDRVLRAIDRLSAVFSGYDSSSEFSRWQAGTRAAVRVAPELFEVLQESDRWRFLSSGTFDPRVKVFSDLWARSAKQDREPSPGELEVARGRLEPLAWRLDPASRSAERLSDCPLTLDGIAKGYIVERATDAAFDEAKGVRGVLLNLGGDMRVRGDLVATIGIAPPWADSETSEPVARFEVRDRSVATSGGSQRGFSVNGRWYSHVLDPRTGRPVDRVASATIIAERSIDADALGKVCNVLSPAESLALVRSLPGVECLIIASDGKITKSDGWHHFEKPAPTPLALSRKESVLWAIDTKSDANPAGWGNDYELVVNYEINRQEDAGRRYRRPYVAVWVENKDGFPVRNLTLWVSLGGAGPFQWLPDMKRWYRSDQERKRVDKKDMVFTIARPTRPAGKYKVIWDGKDDHGKPLPPGEYTILIDAAREHGTYQSMRRQVTLGDRPFTEELKGNVEIRAASLEYRRKSSPR